MQITQKEDKKHQLDHLGHRNRLRLRLETSGIIGFQDYEILELLLTHAIPRKDTKLLAKALVQKFGSLAGVLDASRDDLLSVVGIGPKSAQLLTLLRPVCAAYLQNRLKGRDILNSPEEVIDYCRTAFSGNSHEMAHILFVDTKNRIVAERTIAEGTIDESTVYPRRLIEEALACHASGFILIHNHPSGQVQPSQADKKLTIKILQAAKSVDLRFLDHLIVGIEGYFSFRSNNLFN